jgi:peptidoglycan/xylan/chitin deacetylase (PgdA/CDA1 family)
VTSAARSPRCIVSLTYDDALPCHHETVAPALAAHGLRATFYLDRRVLDAPAAWRSVAAAGHELGNHTLFHPCHDAAWQDPAYNLRHYTPTRWLDEVTLANAILTQLDGRPTRTFGNTCHATHLGAGAGLAPIAPLAAQRFAAARGGMTDRPIALDRIDWFDLGTVPGDGRDFSSLQREIAALAATGGWLLYTFHGVGARDHTLHVAAAEHARLIAWLADQRDWLWVAPVRDVAERCAPALPAR